MAEKTVSVRLKAVVDDYTKAFGSASKATEDLVGKGDRIKALGQSTSALGASLSTRLTLPIVAAGGAMSAMAVTFDNAFTTMQATAGVAASEVSQLKDQVLGLAEETGRGPQELAEALLLIRSSGFEGAEAMAVLEASAKGAAAGMGETREIANAITNVVAGYGSEAITAAQAMDILTASVQEGKAEASEMAPQFGRLVPIAAELGVGFGDVAGSLAYLTRATGDAAQSSTALQGILSKLLRPSQQGAEALESIGLSADELRPKLRDDLLGTLVMLREKLGDSGFQLLFDDVQALNGALQLTGPGMEDARKVIDNVGDSAGKADQAFSKWAQSMGADNARAWAQVQVAMIRFGDVVAPILSDVLGILADLVSVFSDLPGWAQKAVVGFLGMVAALGPLLTVGGNVMKAFGFVQSTFDKLTTSMANSSAAALNVGTNATTSASRMSTAMGIARKSVLALGAAFAGLEFFGTMRANRIADELEGITKGIDVGSLAGVRDQIRLFREELDKLDDREGKGRLFSFEPLGLDAFATTGDADRNERIEQLRDSIAELEKQEESLVGQERETAAAYVGSDEALAGLNEQTVNAVNNLQAHADALAAQLDPLFGMLDALQANREANDAVTVAQQELNQAITDHGPASAEAAAAEQNLAEAHRNAATSAQDVMSATAQLQAGIQSGTISVEQATATLQGWVSQGLITQDTANAMAMGFAFARDRANELGMTNPTVTLTTYGFKESLDSIYGVRAAVSSIPRNIAIEVNYHATGKNVTVRAAGGPVYSGEGYIVGEKGPEWFEPDQNGRIIPHHALSGVMSSGASWGGGYAAPPVRITVDGSGLDRRLKEFFRNAIRVERGGSVQQALGRS